jgi:hypothetical protein
MASSLGRTEKLFELGLIKADHGLPIDDGDGGGSEPELQEFLKGGWIFTDVLGLEGDTLSRKKLFLLVATASARLCVQHDLFRHGFLPGGKYRCLRVLVLRAKPIEPRIHYMGLRQVGQCETWFLRAGRAKTKIEARGRRLRIGLCTSKSHGTPRRGPVVWSEKKRGEAYLAPIAGIRIP